MNERRKEEFGSKETSLFIFILEITIPTAP